MQKARYGKCSISVLFSGSLLLVLAKFSFFFGRGGGCGGGDWALGYNSLRFRHYPELFQFPKILIASLKALSRSATREATRIYQFTTNNQASFHLW